TSEFLAQSKRLTYGPPNRLSVHVELPTARPPGVTRDAAGYRPPGVTRDAAGYRPPGVTRDAAGYRFLCRMERQGLRLAAEEACRRRHTPLVTPKPCAIHFSIAPDVEGGEDDVLVSTTGLLLSVCLNTTPQTARFALLKGPVSTVQVEFPFPFPAPQFGRVYLLCLAGTGRGYTVFGALPMGPSALLARGGHGLTNRPISLEVLKDHVLLQMPQNVKARLIGDPVADAFLLIVCLAMASAGTEHPISLLIASPEPGAAAEMVRALSMCAVRKTTTAVVAGKPYSGFKRRQARGVMAASVLDTVGPGVLFMPDTDNLGAGPARQLATALATGTHLGTVLIGAETSRCPAPLSEYYDPMDRERERDRHRREAARWPVFQL
ncbi:hypothetical protein KIPB_004965, partial [Kipferlia bialata]